MAVQRHLHSRSTLDRVDAVRQLANFSPLEGAKLAVKVGLADREADVQRPLMKRFWAGRTTPRLAISS